MTDQIDDTYKHDEEPSNAVPTSQSRQPIVRPKGSSGRALNFLLGLALVVAVGGMAFAVGRLTAPPQANAGVGPGGGFQGPPGASFGPGGGFQGLPGASFDPANPPRGFGGETTISGIVTSVDGTTMTLTTAAGQTLTIDVSHAAYHAQADATASDVAIGASVKVSAGGFGGRPPFGNGVPPSGAPAPSGSTTLTASEVTIVAP